MKKFKEVIKSFQNDAISKKGILVPIYWSEDDKGNINFDIDSIRNDFELMIDSLEEYNDNSDFIF